MLTDMPPTRSPSPSPIEVQPVRAGVVRLVRGPFVYSVPATREKGMDLAGCWCAPDAVKPDYTATFTQHEGDLLRPLLEAQARRGRGSAPSSTPDGALIDRARAALGTPGKPVNQRELAARLGIHHGLLSKARQKPPAGRALLPAHREAIEALLKSLKSAK